MKMMTKKIDSSISDDDDAMILNISILQPCDESDCTKKAEKESFGDLNIGAFF